MPAGGGARDAPRGELRCAGLTVGWAVEPARAAVVVLLAPQRQACAVAWASGERKIKTDRPTEPERGTLWLFPLQTDNTPI